jgi:hypothetical protein
MLWTLGEIMRTFFTAILTISFCLLQAQNVDTKTISSDKKEFKNQGEQEDYWAEQLFEKDYKKQTFEKYTGDIVVDKNFFKYAEQVLEIDDTSKKELTAIFSKGLFYPSIITGVVITNPKSNEELNKMTTSEKAVYGLIRTDSLRISLLEEVPFLSKSPKQKRFRFWLIRKGRANPEVCFIELTNPNATSGTDIKTFVDGAVLTFYRQAWTVI